VWGTLFSFVNGLALIAWLALVLLPRAAFVKTAIMYLGVGLLALVYTVLMALVLGGAVDPAGPPLGSAASFASIEGIRALSASDGGVVIGWTHYLAFDLFVGLWIANDADNKGFSRLWQAPVLLATFLAGPLGLLVWLIVRERRARALIRTGSS
jgi:hypothetical protein